MTSPSSRLIMATRAPSRFSSGICCEYNLVHPERCAARKQAFLVFGELREHRTEVLSFGFGRVGQHRNVTRLWIEFEHRQDLKSVETLNACAQDHQVGEHLLDLRVRTITWFNENHVVATSVEHRFKHAENFGIAVDDNNLLNWRRE